MTGKGLFGRIAVCCMTLGILWGAEAARAADMPAPITEELVATDADITYLQEQYKALSEQYRKEKTFARTALAAAVFVVAVLLVIVVNLLLRIREYRRMLDGDDDADEDFFADEDDDADEEIYVKENADAGIPAFAEKKAGASALAPAGALAEAGGAKEDAFADEDDGGAPGFPVFGKNGKKESDLPRVKERICDIEVIDFNDL